MCGNASQPAIPQLPGQVLIASVTASGLSPNTQRYKSINNNAGRSPKPMRRSALPVKVALSCSVRNFSQTRSAMQHLRIELSENYHLDHQTVKISPKVSGTQAVCL